MNAPDLRKTLLLRETVMVDSLGRHGAPSNGRRRR